MSKEIKLLHYADVLAWVQRVPGEFSFADIDRELAVNDEIGYLDRTIILEDMVVNGELERCGTRRGIYRRPEKKLIQLDILEADVDPLDIVLPMGMSGLVNILPGNIITIGGEKNAGKTALLLNIAFDNRDKFDVHYFNSEMGPAEIKLRCQKFSDTNHFSFSEWRKIKFFERSEFFADAIATGPDKLNIIDFYECHDEFYKMGEGIRRIHDRLDGGVAVIAIQKNPNSGDPIGGRRVTEKSRLHLTLSLDRHASFSHKLKIEVGKNWATEINPNGYGIFFSLVQGCRMHTMDRPGQYKNAWGYVD